MVFKCQEDSFLKEFASKVVLCEEAELNPKLSDRPEERVKGFNVVLEDTILFPEGGGQPCDHGFLNEKQVIDVQRKGRDAIHFVVSETPFSIGETVVEKVDWARRYDHMQQHSGQHLITALFEREYNLPTKSWSLGLEISYIELDPSFTLTQEQIDHVERICNELIAQAGNVKTHVLKEHSTDAIPAEITRATRGLPKDHVGAIRVITIEGIESNLCCGTHVTNLCQLQCIKLLHIERTKNRQFLHFLVGGRVLRKLNDCCKRETQLNGILNGGPPSHLDLVKKLQTNQKASQRTLLKCLKEIASFEGEKLKSLPELPRWYSLHRQDGIEPDFINAFLRSAPAISDTDMGLALLFLTVGDDSGKGHLVLQGQADIVSKLGPTICDILEGKGNGKGQRFQAKINNLKRISECEKKIKEFFAI